MIDICPVGALTSKPYAFTARPWELKRHETIDVTDAVGSNIIADTKGPAVMRILPRLHEDINEEWIHDKIRFCYDGLKKQRLDRPYRRNSDGKLMPVTWDDALEVIADHIKQTNGSNIAALAGDLADVESMYALKSFMQKLGSDHYDARIDGMKIMPNPEHRGDYLFNTTIAGIEQADAILIIGSNPRHEAALINARIRKTWLNDRIPIGLIGPGVELTYPYTHIGTGGGDLLEFAHGNHDFYKKLVDAERPMVILGAGALNRTDGGAIHDVTRRIAQDTGMVRDDWNGFNILHTDAARVGALEIGFSSTTTADIIKKSQVGAMDIIYLHGVDRPWVNDLDNSFVIYQGHHGDRGAAVADVILPGAAFTEKNALYVNTEGRPQVARLATNPPGQAREDWKIIRRLADELDMQLGFDTVAELRQIIIDQYPHLGQVDQITPGAVSDAPDLSQIDEILGQDFNSPVDNFYQTDVITRASTNMAKATEQLLGRPHHRANDELEPIIPNVMEADG
jgi:NADH-quinone oxidoreductase subunit G